MVSSLKEFRAVFADFRSTASLAVKGSLAVPLVAAWVKLGPPPRTLVALLTPLAQMLALIWAFHFWGRRPQRRLNPLMRLSLVAFCILLGLALFLNYEFTYSRADGNDPI